MNEKVKHRLVGFGVILGMAVIFLPTLVRHKTNQFEAPLPAQVFKHPKAPSQPVVAAKKIEWQALPVDKAPPVKLSTSITTQSSSVAVVNALPVKQLKIKHRAVHTQKKALVHIDAPRRRAKQHAPIVKASKRSLMTPQKVYKAAVKPAHKTSKKQTAMLLGQPSKEKHPIIGSKLHKTIGQPHYIVQLASFRNIDNAKRLVKRLEALGFQPYRFSEKNNQGVELTKVLLGRVATKGQAVELMEKIAASTNIKGLVIQG